MIDPDGLVEVVPSSDGERFGIWCLWSRVGGHDLFLEETDYRQWADFLASRLRTGLRHVVEAVRGEVGGG